MVQKRMGRMLFLLALSVCLCGCARGEAGHAPETQGETRIADVPSTDGAYEDSARHISMELDEQLTVDAEVILPEEQGYRVYALTKKAFARENLDVFFGASEADVTDHPEWTGAYSAAAKEGGSFRTDPLGNFTYARDEERDESIVYLVESAYYDAGSGSFREEEIPDLSFQTPEEAIWTGKEKIKELTGQDSEVLAMYALNREKLTQLEEKYRQTQKYQEDAQRGKAAAVHDWSDADEMYYMEYELTKDGLPIYSGINEPGISVAVETIWTAETRITMLLDKDGIRYITGRGGIFDASPEAEARTILPAEAALEAVKEIYGNTILSSRFMISRIWLEYVVVPDWNGSEQYNLMPYWCVQIDSPSGTSSAERINAITGDNLAYGG